MVIAVTAAGCVGIAEAVADPWDTCKRDNKNSGISSAQLQLTISAGTETETRQELGRRLLYHRVYVSRQGTYWRQKIIIKFINNL